MQSDLTCRNCGPSNRPIHPMMNTRQQGFQNFGGVHPPMGFPGQGGPFPNGYGAVQMNASPQNFFQQQQLQQHQMQQQMQQQHLQANMNGGYNTHPFAQQGPIANSQNFLHRQQQQQQQQFLQQNMQARGQNQAPIYSDPHFYGPNSGSDVHFGQATDSSFGQYRGQGNILPPNLRKISGSGRLDNMMNRTHKIVEQYRNNRDQRDSFFDAQASSPQNATYGSVSMFDPSGSSNSFRSL